MLSYSTGESGFGADVDKVREATKLVREKRPDLLVEGPIQYDAASEPSVAATKMPDSAVAGVATVFIFPGPQHREQHLQGSPTELGSGSYRARFAGSSKARE
jgi:hypothetical protein